MNKQFKCVYTCDRRLKSDRNLLDRRGEHGH